MDALTEWMMGTVDPTCRHCGGPYIEGDNDQWHVAPRGDVRFARQLDEHHTPEKDTEAEATWRRAMGLEP